MKSTRGWAVVATVCMTAAWANAQGVVIVQRETIGAQSTTTRMQMDKDHIRTETRSGNDETAFVFDGPKNVLRMVNTTKKTYSEITTAEIQQMGGMMAQMQAQMANLPPEQRALMEQMMQGRGGAGLPAGLRGMPGATAAPRVEYKQTGSDKVGQWTCTKYEGTTGGQKTSEVCTVAPAALNLTPADFQAAQKLAEFMKSLMPDIAGTIMVNATTQDQGFAGVPVKRTTFRNGTVASTSEITEIRREAIPASTFDAPAGFQKESMPGRGR